MANQADARRTALSLPEATEDGGFHTDAWLCRAPKHLAANFSKKPTN